MFVVRKFVATDYHSFYMFQKYNNFKFFRYHHAHLPQTTQKIRRVPVVETVLCVGSVFHRTATRSITKIRKDACRPFLKFIFPQFLRLLSIQPFLNVKSSNSHNTQQMHKFLFFQLSHYNVLVD